MVANVGKKVFIDGCSTLNIVPGCTCLGGESKKEIVSFSRSTVYILLQAFGFNSL
jgi:hypothetical protein